jgi:hypothetical protein
MYNVVATRRERGGGGGLHNLLRLKQRYLGVALLTGFLHVTSMAAFHPVRLAAGRWGGVGGGAQISPLPFGSFQSRATSSIKYSRSNNHILVVQDPGTWHLVPANPQQRMRYSRLFTSPSAQSFDNDTENSSAAWEEGNDNDEYEYDDGDSMSMEDGEEEESSSPSLWDEYQAWNKALDKAIVALDKKQNSLASELTKAKGAEDTVARAQLLVSNLYMFTSPQIKSVTVQDWNNDGNNVELKLDPKYSSAAEEADALFAQVRKLKRGSQVVSDLLEKTGQALELLQETQIDLTSAASPTTSGEDDEDAGDSSRIDEGRFALVQDRLKRTSAMTNFQMPTVVSSEDPIKRRQSTLNNINSKRKPPKPPIGSPASNIRKLVSPGGCTVLVGRNRRGNEHLSLTVARGADIWMHSRGCPGAHVVIFNRRGGPTPSEACLQFGADLAIFYSDMRSEKKAEVSAAEPKHLLKPRGAPLGAIKVRQEWRTLVGKPDQVPDELKSAREESGQSDEYRTIDKAKHRKRTTAVAKEIQDKRRKLVKDKKKRQQQQSTAESDSLY